MINKLIIINFGKFKFKDAETLFDEYYSRIKHYVKTEIKEIKISKDEPKYFEAVKDKFLDYIKDSKLIIFSEKSKSITSLEFAGIIEKIEGNLAIVVGTSWGYPEYILNKAAYSISFGNMTLPHELVRVLSAEQVYRALTIIKGEKYNK